MFQHIFALALVPIEKVDELWNDILATKPDILNLDAFLDYFVSNYFEGSFPIELWNHFLTQGPRTNNHIEGHNLKLKKCIGVAHPDQH